MGWGTFIAGQVISNARRSGRNGKAQYSPEEIERGFRTLLAPVKSFAYALPVNYPKELEFLGRDYRLAHPPVWLARFGSVLLWCLFLGTLGAHRFKTGKHGTAWLMLLTGGGMGIWYLIDLFKIATFQFKDYWGRTIRPGA